MQNYGVFHSGANISLENLLTKLAIFGDSFAAPIWKNKQRHHWTWVNRLSTNYDTDNRAMIGTGPDYALEQFLQYTEENLHQTQNTCVIFVSSDAHRLNLKDFWEKDIHQVQIFGVADRSIPHPKHMFVRDLFRHLMTPGWSSKEQHKIASTVSSMSHLYKRVLFWPAVELYPIYTQMIDLHMDLVDTGLFNISKRGLPVNASGIDDDRVNHFEPKDHDIIYTQLCEWIQSGTPIDTSRINPASNSN